jgi:hypothetical protein
MEGRAGAGKKLKLQFRVLHNYAARDIDCGRDDHALTLPAY